MVLDIKIFRNHPEVVYNSQRKRCKSTAIVDEVIELDRQWMTLKHRLEMLSYQINSLSKEIKILFVAKDIESANHKKEQAANIKREIKSLKLQVAGLKQLRDVRLNTIGNIVDDDVPVSDDEKDNVVVSTVLLDADNNSSGKTHHELLLMVGGVDQLRGAKVSGSRGYFLTNVGVRLNYALIQYGLDFLRQRDYIEIATPLLMNPSMMSLTAQLEDFDDQLYRVRVNNNNEDDKYLIATSEQPISAFHANEKLTPQTIRYAGISNCFRKEVGKGGVDVHGIFRVHEFQKVEQFVITTPDKSEDLHQQMTNISSEFLASLGLPHRVVNIVSGELNNAASKKYDIEGWFPGSGQFRELVSSSNCTDYQSRSLNIRFHNSKKYVHMLNATLCATTRVICCILENHQTETGVIVPPVLRPYMGGMEIMPYIDQ